MIKLDFVEPETEEWQAWVSQCKAETEALIARVAHGEEPHITDLYKDERMKRVYVSDEAPFFGKCAYCESRIVGSQPGDIEHFRPENKVTDEDRRDIMIMADDGTTVAHPGYYWLAYDWRNLLYACADCNRPSSFKTGGVLVGKWDKFPVRGQHASRPGDEASEAPLLLNPLFRDPKEHFAIDETGVICSRTDEGGMCVRIFGLNLREALVHDRAEAIYNARNAIHALVTSCAQRNVEEIREQYKKLERIKSGAAPFAMAGRFVLDRAASDFASFFELLGVSAVGDTHRE